MKLYFISDPGDDSDDKSDNDLFVWANDPDEAVRLWRDYYWDGQSEDGHNFPHNMFEVPLRQPVEPLVIRWHGVSDFAISMVDIPTKIACEALGIATGREEQ